MKLLNMVLLLAVSTTLLGQDKWTPEEIIHTKSVGAPTYSPDGTKILWSKRTGLKKDDRFVSKLYLTHLNVMRDGQPLTVQFTQGTSSDYNGIFSKDGDWVYFLSSRDKGKKLWRMSVYGGEPEKVHEFKNGISGMRWLGDDELAFTAREGKSLYDLTNEKNKDNTQIIEDSAHWNPTRVYAFHVKDKKIRRLTNKKHRVSQFAVSRDGNYLVTGRTMSLHNATDGQPKDEITLYNLASGSHQVILSKINEPGSFQFAPDNSGFYFLSTTTSDEKWSGAGKLELYYYNLSNDQYAKVPLNWNNGMAYSYHLAGNHVIAALANGPLKKIGVYQKNGNTWTERALDFGDMKEHVSVQAVSEDGRKIAFNHSTAMKLPRWFSASFNVSRRGSISLANQVEFVKLNDNLKKKPVARAEIIYWEGALGEQVNGILYYPKGYEQGKKYPLILSIHGGPTGVDQDSWSERWSTYPQIYTDKGAFVLKPNYHGSGLHGQEFAESIKKGKYYELDQIDLFNGIQHLKARGMVDMDKLGLMGWSNGAILTTWMTLKYPDMFKVAAPGAGDINWTSDYGTCRFGVTFDQYYFGGAPWDDMNGKHYNEWYIQNSPIFEIEKIKTPTIIFHGSEDRAVPRDQGWEYYRGLQQVGKAPVKFLWFPGQPHGLQKITHQLRKMNEEIKWIDKYLFGEEEEVNEAYKKESPLATALEISSAGTVNGVFGIETQGKLIPEFKSIAQDSTSIARFELTNAQYAAFDNNHSYHATMANYPVYDLTKEQVEDYVSWLNGLGLGTFRLPNKKEGEALHKKAAGLASKENTLNYWSGYAINKEDAAQLTDKLGEANLIKPVGSFSAVKIKEAKIFDLGGNVAEYYVDGEELKVYGYDAHTFVDPYDRANNPSKMIGVRLIKE